MSLVTDLDTHGWLRPSGVIDPEAARWTRLGTLDGSGEPLVDPNGLVQVAPGRPGIDWWIAGDDRWYFPSQESSVRQSLVRGTPVVETRMRIKGGDVCQRTYATMVSLGGIQHEAVVMEVENATGVPCGVAFAVRPFGIVQRTPIHRVEFNRGVMLADGVVCVVSHRPPAGALVAAGADGDLTDRVKRGEANATTCDPVDCDAGFAQGVMVVPLAHRAVFRVLLPLPTGRDGRGHREDWERAALPPSENVANGWRALVRDAARVRVPDPRVQAFADAVPAALLATTSGREVARGRSIWDHDDTPRWDHVAAVAGALDRFGLDDRAALLLARAADEIEGDVTVGAESLVMAFATHLRRFDDRAFAVAVAPSCARVLALQRRDRMYDPRTVRSRRTLESAADIFDSAGETRARDRARREIRESVTGPEPAVAPRTRLEVIDAAVAMVDDGDARGAFRVLDRLLDEASSTGTWSDVIGATGGGQEIAVGAAVASLLADLLVRGSSGRVDLVTFLPDAWITRPVEAHGFATGCGRFGFAVRWHGARPALLWEAADELRAREYGDLTIHAPALDPEWIGSGSSGEALLEFHDDAAVPPKAGARISGLTIGSAKTRKGER